MVSHPTRNSQSVARFVMKLLSGMLSFILLTALSTAMPAYGRSPIRAVRPPVWAGKFYPAQAGELKKVLDDFARLAQKTPLTIPQNKGLRAVILPHAGYIYSGWTAAHASRVFAPALFDKIIVMAPDHRVGLTNGAISRVDAYQTPLGRIQLHPDAEVLRRQHEFFSSNRFSDETEHAVEVVLPVLQHFLGPFEMIPIVLGPSRADVIAESILPILDERTLLVVSSDLSHYLPYTKATVKDHQTIEMILACDGQKLSRQENAACGKIPLTVLLHIAKKLDWMPVLLHYANSGDTAGSRDRVVGYAAIAFYGDLPVRKTPGSPKHLTRSQGRLLVQLARLSIEDQLFNEKKYRVIPFVESIAPYREFQQAAGTFVTLQRRHQLRGCMGNLAASQSMLEGIKSNAVQAAFHDPRFPPLTAEELEGLRIEVSILSQPQPLAYENGNDLIAKLRVNSDGVIIRKGASRATFLPQVWQQLPDPKTFLSRLCLKAGLSADAWQHAGLEVMTYQVQHFDEKN
jgi:AmmeMemoRadiSam system protein B/AmmeMemoRadiSam system protein A